MEATMNISKEYFAKQIEANGRQPLEERLAAYLADDYDCWDHETICSVILTGHRGLQEMTDDELAETLSQYYYDQTIEEFEVA
jgi:hypothetical protein